MGSSEFGIPALQKLIDCGHRVTGVVTIPPKPRGRGLGAKPSPIEEYARRNGLSPILTPSDLESGDFLGQVCALGADLAVVVAFRLLPDSVLALPRLGTLNIHASLLPRYRGAAPIQRAIAAGETETGVTVFAIDRGIDTGNIIVQRRTTIGPEETTPQLSERLGALGAEALIEAVDLIGTGRARYLRQDDSQATKAPKLRKSEGRIDWSLPAQTIYNRMRAYKPFPGARTELGGKVISVEWAVPVDEKVAGSKPPGTIVRVGPDWFDVQCGDQLLRVFEVTPEGRRRMDAGSYLRGARVAQGGVFR